jgi:hypothetical protein
MAASNDYSCTEPEESVLVDSKLNILSRQVAHVPIRCRRITRKIIEDLATEKYRSCGKGITFQDLQKAFFLTKPQAQRSLKYYHDGRVLFTAGDLNSQGIYLIENTNPQQYFPSCKKADILEDLKKRSRNVQVEPTGSNLYNLSNHSNRANALSNILGNHKAQSFLDVLILLPFAQLHIHRLQLTLFIDREYYQTLTKKAMPINLGKPFEVHIGRRYVNYIFYRNGRVEIAIRSTDTPFKLENDEDVSVLFSFFGQVRDRLIHWVSDVWERKVPGITDWILKACDLNKDVEIDERAQLCLPDIQLKYAGQVFRMYIKSLQDRAVCRVERSLTLGVPLVQALEGIMFPTRAFNGLRDEITQLRQEVASMSTKHVPKL